MLMNTLYYIQEFGSQQERITGMPLYDFVNWIFLFSFVGYIIECIDVSIENRKIVTNRGFVHGPFCIIYGLVALIATAVLRPFLSNPIALFIASAIFATTAEYTIGMVMLHLFGELWWDYSKRPFNYKGIICLSTSIGWGILGLAFFGFLNRIFLMIVTSIPIPVAMLLSFVLLIYYIMDFSYCLYRTVRGKNNEENVVGRFRLK